MPAAPVVLLHGVGLDRTLWDAFAASLDAETIALDLPGHGAEPALRAPQTLADLADDVLRRLPDGAVHLVGFSLGALVAQQIAVQDPDRALTLTCVSGVCRRTDAERAAVLARLDSARDDFAASVQASLERWYPAGTGVAAETIAQTRRTLRAQRRRSRTCTRTRCSRRGTLRSRPRLGEITEPDSGHHGRAGPRLDAGHVRAGWSP
ncbi:alpha/beta fold hydrolase [Microbacterium aurum]